MFMSFRFCLCAGLALGAIILLSHSAAAQTPHCFNSLSGPEVPCTPRSSGDGGGYIAPAPSGPSPAEIARRKRIAAGNAANERGIKAFERGDLRAAVRYFEEAARLWPEDRKVQGNYWNAKGELADSQKDPAAAVKYYQKALRFYPGDKDITSRLELAKRDAAIQIGDWDTALRISKRLAGNDSNAAIYLHYLRGRQALAEKDWSTAIDELRAHDAGLRESYEELEGNLRKLQKSLRTLQNDKSVRSSLLLPIRTTVVQLQNAMQKNQERRNQVGKYLEMARAGKAREEQKKEAQRREQASNPNYPNPPPVYRDANTLRSYPDLGSYTPAQHAAHNDNDTGNTWAQKGDWMQAMLSYERALVEDPDGPFSKVIKENLDIAMKHLLNEERAKSASAAAPSNPAAMPAPAKPVQESKKREEIADANCTRWSIANGKSSRVCMDAQAHHYCEESDGKTVSRVSCQ